MNNTLKVIDIFPHSLIDVMKILELVRKRKKLSRVFEKPSNAIRLTAYKKYDY